MKTNAGTLFAEKFIALSAKVKSKSRKGRPATQREIADILGIQPLQVYRYRAGLSEPRDQKAVLGALREAAKGGGR